MADAPVPIIEWPDYTISPTGGDVMTQDLNALYNKGDLCWLLVCTALCWQITPVQSPIAHFRVISV
jgi:Amt family ammonium transporter